MEQKNLPFLLSFLALALFLPWGVLPKSKPEADQSQPASQAHEAAESAESKSAQAGLSEAGDDVWASVARFYGEYFGLETQGSGEARIQSLFREAAPEEGPRHYELKFVIALVPDPIDSHLPLLFDQALEGIQQAYADSGYLLDRFWLPWEGSGAAGTGLHRNLPGLLLFRNVKDSKARVLTSVLLVGESPKSGIQKSAFDRAVRLSVFGGQPEISVVGPSFSGSIESVRLALSRYRRKPSSRPGAGQPLHFDLVSGTATAPHLERELSELGRSVSLCRTVVPDDVLLDEALKRLVKDQDWDRRRLLLLTEADTGYGQSRGGKTEDERIYRAFFPSGIAEIRTAWEQGRESRDAAGDGAIAVPRESLDLNLEGHGKPRDVIPRFDRLSVADNDLALSSLLRTLSRERMRYVGIMATDVRDKIFLAEKVRRYSPDALLFTVENDLLYGHPAVGEGMNGMLVLSNFPLYTSGQRGLPLSGGQHLRQSSSEFQQGFFQATRYAVQFPRASRPAEAETSSRRYIWISAVRNGSVWPVRRIETKVENQGVCPTPLGWDSQAGERESTVRASPERKDLQLMLFLVGVYFLVCLLDRILVPPDLIGNLHTELERRVVREDRWAWRIAERLKSETTPTRWRRTRRRLKRIARWQERLTDWNARMTASRMRPLALAVSVLWVAAGVALFLGLFPLVKIKLGIEMSIFLAGGLPVLYILFIRRLGVLAWPYFEPAARRILGRLSWWPQLPVPLGSLRWAPAVLWSGIAVALPVALAWVLNKLWAPGENELFFFFRVRAFAGGMSPLVSLIWLGAALYLWAFLELRRLRRIVRHELEWPLHAASEPVLSNLPKAADRLRRFLLDTRPPRSWRTVGFAIVILPPAVLLWHVVQPIAEPKGYGRLLLVLCLGTLTLGAVAFYRFVKLWLLLQNILERLEHTPMIKALGRLSPRLGWTPMRSFWDMPAFNVVLLSLRKMALIERCGLLRLEAEQARVNAALDKAFEARSSGPLKRERGVDRKALFRRELAARREIQDVFQEVGRLLADLPRNAVAESYFAVRIVAYVRHCFLHMRDCLIEALVCGVCTLVAVSTYAFQPKQFVSLVLWLLLAGAVGVTIWVFVQMDRNAALSAIGGSEPGKVTFDRVFILNVLTYGAIPLLSIVATQFPDLGLQFLRWINPALRVAGID